MSAQDLYFTKCPVSQEPSDGRVGGTLAQEATASHHLRLSTDGGGGGVLTPALLSLRAAHPDQTVKVTPHGTYCVLFLGPLF